MTRGGTRVYSGAVRALAGSAFCGAGYLKSDGYYEVWIVDEERDDGCRLGDTMTFYFGADEAHIGADEAAEKAVFRRQLDPPLQLDLTFP